MFSLVGRTTLGRSSPPETTSAERRAFEHYLRTGRRLAPPAAAPVPERKFNPYHDPRNGRFTFAPGGPQSLQNALFSDRRGLWKRLSAGEDRNEREETQATQDALEGLLEAILDTHPPRSRGGRQANSQLPKRLVLLGRLFPALARAGPGAIVPMAASLPGNRRPAQRLIRSIHRARVRRLLSEIKKINPRYDTGRATEQTTPQGQVNQIKTLKFDLAVLLATKRGDFRLLEVEVINVMQEVADLAYDQGVELYNSGHLRPRLNREEAIGNHVDRAVRRELRNRFGLARIDYSQGPVRVQGREYITSDGDRTYRMPDARVGRLALDATISMKTLADGQIRGFFDGDFRPEFVAIIRPTQIGGSYLIKRP